MFDKKNGKTFIILFMSFSLYLNDFISFYNTSISNCGEVVLPRLNTALKEKGYEMCLQCKCKHESKYIGTIKLIALIVIWISSLLVTYMAFMIILNPLFIKKIQAGNNQVRKLVYYLRIYI